MLANLFSVEYVMVLLRHDNKRAPGDCNAFYHADRLVVGVTAWNCVIFLFGYVYTVYDKQHDWRTRDTPQIRNISIQQECLRKVVSAQSKCAIAATPGITPWQLR